MTERRPLPYAAAEAVNNSADLQQIVLKDIKTLLSRASIEDQRILWKMAFSISQSLRWLVSAGSQVEPERFDL